MFYYPSPTTFTPAKVAPAEVAPAEVAPAKVAPTETKIQLSLQDVVHQYAIRRQNVQLSVDDFDHIIKGIAGYTKVVIWIINVLLLCLIGGTIFALWQECNFSLSSCSSVIYAIIYTCIVIMISITSVGYWIINSYSRKLKTLVKNYN